MPTRPDIPPPGTPLSTPGQLHDVLDWLAAGAGRQDWPQHGIVATEGTATTPGPQVSLALFKLTGRWTNAALPAGQSWPYQPSPANWHYAPATRVEYYPAAGTWNTAADQGDTATAAESGYVWHQAGLQLGSADPARSLPAAIEAAGDFMPAVGNGQWVWCFYDEGPGCWVVLQPFEDIVRVKLTQDLYACGWATAVILLAANDITSGDGFYTSAQLTVYDPLGVVAASLAARQDSAGHSYVPAGTPCYVKRFADDNAWEPLLFGTSPCSSSSSGSSSGSSGSSSFID